MAPLQTVPTQRSATDTPPPSRGHHRYSRCFDASPGTSTGPRGCRLASGGNRVAKDVREARHTHAQGTGRFVTACSPPWDHPSAVPLLPRCTRGGTRKVRPCSPGGNDVCALSCTHSARTPKVPPPSALCNPLILIPTAQSAKSAFLTARSAKSAFLTAQSPHPHSSLPNPLILILITQSANSPQDCVEFDSTGRPINPVGRTGLRGRGMLGKWGPNYTCAVAHRYVLLHIATRLPGT